MEAPLIGIVDDDEAVRDATSSLVRSAGFGAAVFSSAETFLASDQIHNTGCLILDVRMPGLNGLDLQSRLAGMERPIPIISRQLIQTVRCVHGLSVKVLLRFCTSLLMMNRYFAPCIQL